MSPYSTRVSGASTGPRKWSTGGRTAPPEHAEEDRAQRRRHDPRREDADGRLLPQPLGVEGEVGDEQGDGEAQPGEGGAAPDAGEGDAGRQRAQPEADGESGRETDAEEL